MIFLPENERYFGPLHVFVLGIRPHDEHHEDEFPYRQKTLPPPGTPGEGGFLERVRLHHFLVALDGLGQEF